jgi:lysophospholipase L1-like esterase
VRGRELLAGIVLAAVGIVFALAVLEVGVRWLHLVSDRFWESDPLLGVHLIPGRRGWWTQEDREFLVPVQINSHGLRDVEHEFTKPSGVFRILVLGDSFVEAMHVPLDATFGRLLEQQLNTSPLPQRAEVISAGVSGYGTAGATLSFERDGKRYQPDLVLLAFYPGNDIKNNSPTLEDTLKPIYAEDGTLQKVVGNKPQKRPHGWRAMAARFKAYHYLRQVLLVRHPDLAARLAHLGVLKRDAIRTAPERGGIPVDYGVYAPIQSPEWRDAWQHTENLLERLQQAVTASGARLVIAVIGTRDQIYPDWWGEVITAHPRMQGERWDLDAPQHRIEHWCAAHAVPCMALAPGFRAVAERGGDPLHFHHDGHWTVAGHRLGAALLTDFLKSLSVGSTGQGASNETH